MENVMPDALAAAAEAKIIATRDKIAADQKHVRTEQRRLSELERDLDRKMADCLAAARFFGIEIVEEVDDETIADTQRRVRVYEMRLRASETEAERRHAFEQLHRFRARLADLVARKEAQASQTNLQRTMELPPPEPTAFQSNGAAPKVREIALDRLQAAGDAGQKAADIRSFIEQAYPTKLHEKTVGMTLYRLSQENLVHRKGQVWFFGPTGDQSVAIAKNPGADTPGQMQDADQGRSTRDVDNRPHEMTT